MIRIVVDPAPIDLAAEMARAELPGVGAVATFTGLVRPDPEASGSVSVLELEHYPGATEAALLRLAEDGMARWSLSAVTVVHRVGPIGAGERIVFVATAGAHRGAALDACAFLIDRLKTDAPFWKREVRGSSANWVEARDGDVTSAARWSGSDDPEPR